MTLVEFFSRSPLTQTEVARRAGISQPYLSQVQNHLRLPELDIAERIVKATDGAVTLGDLRPDVIAIVVRCRAVEAGLREAA